MRTLPKKVQARIDSHRTIDVLGPGWGAPFEVFVTDPSGPVTTGVAAAGDGTLAAPHRTAAVGADRDRAPRDHQP